MNIRLFFPLHCNFTNSGQSTELVRSLFLAGQGVGFPEMDWRMGISWAHIMVWDVVWEYNRAAVMLAWDGYIVHEHILR